MNVKAHTLAFMTAMLAACGTNPPDISSSKISKSPDVAPTPDPTNPPGVTDNADAGACIPVTCAALGYTCGSFTSCGEVQVCGTCGDNTYCSKDDVGTCEPYEKLCPSQSLTLTGACVHNGTPIDHVPSPICFVEYPNIEVTEYRTNATPSPTTQAQCEALDQPSTYTCYNNITSTAHTYTWLDTVPKHTGTSGCHITGYQAGTCTDTVAWYDSTINSADPATRCANAGGTLLTE